MHGENAQKHGHPGREYWKSRLHPHGEVPGKFTKIMTHRKERRQGKAENHGFKNTSVEEK